VANGPNIFQNASCFNTLTNFLSYFLNCSYIIGHPYNVWALSQILEALATTPDPSGRFSQNFNEAGPLIFSPPFREVQGLSDIPKKHVYRPSKRKEDTVISCHGLHLYSLPSLLLIAQAVYLLERGHMDTQSCKVTNATDHLSTAWLPPVWVTNKGFKNRGGSKRGVRGATAHPQSE